MKLHAAPRSPLPDSPSSSCDRRRGFRRTPRSGIAAAIAFISCRRADRVLARRRCTSVGTLIVGSKLGHIGPGGHAALGGGDCRGRRAFHDAGGRPPRPPASFRTCCGANSFGPIISATRPLPHSATFSAIFDPAGAGFVGIGRGARVALHERPHALRRTCARTARRCSRPSKSRRARSARESPSASSNSARSSAYCSIEMPRSGSTVPPAAIWPKPRRSGAITRASLGERFDLRVPHRVVEREAVDEQDGRAGAAVDVGERRRWRVRRVFMRCNELLSRKRATSRTAIGIDLVLPLWSLRSLLLLPRAPSRTAPVAAA